MLKNTAGQRFFFGLVAAADGTALTGATVTVKRALDGAAQASATGTVTELGGGQYRFNPSQADTNADHIGFLFTATGAVAVSANIETRAADPLTAALAADAVWDEALSGHTTAGTAGKALADAGGAADPLSNTVPGAYASGTAGAALGKIGGGNVMTVGPVAPAGDVAVVRGDDYAAADSRDLSWTDNAAAWPDLTSATIMLDALGTSWAGAVVTPTGPGKVRVELTAAQTSALNQGTGRYTLRATLSGGAVVTLAQGGFVVKAN